MKIVLIICFSLKGYEETFTSKMIYLNKNYTRFSASNYMHSTVMGLFIFMMFDF